MVYTVYGCALIFMAGEQVCDAHGPVRLPVHEELHELRTDRSDPGPFRNGIGPFEATQTQDIQGVPSPTEQRYSLDDGKTHRVVRPDAAIHKTDGMLCNVLGKIRRRRGGRECGVYRKRLEIVSESPVMRRLIDIDRSRNRVPRRDEQPGPRVTDSFVAEHVS